MMENEDSGLETPDNFELIRGAILECLFEEGGWDEKPSLADRVAARTMLEMVYSFIEANKWHHDAAIRVAVARRELEAALQALINLQEDAHAARDADALLACIKTIDEIAARYSKKSHPDLILKRQGRPRQRSFRFYVELLAWNYLRFCGRWPTVTYDPVSGEYRGHFLEWALKRLAQIEEEQVDGWPKDGQTRARAIARLLKEERPKDLEELIRP